MLHTNSRGEEGIFYKVPGRMGVYTLKVRWSHCSFSLLFFLRTKTTKSFTNLSHILMTALALAPSRFSFSCMKANVFFALFYSHRRTSLTWRKSSQRTAQRIAVTISQTPKAEKTTAGPSLKRAGEDAGCGEVLHCIHQSSCCDACGLPGRNTHNSSYPANFSSSKYRFPNTLKL